MKSLSTDYKNHVALNSTTLCTLVRILRKDSTEYLFTDFDSDLTSDGKTYKAANSFIPTDFQSSASLSVDNLDITGIIAAMDGITEDDIYREFFYDAEIWVSVVNYNAPDDGVNKILYGSLGELTLQENVYIVEFRNLTYKLTRNLANVFSKTCRVEFGSTKCGIGILPTTWQQNTVYCAGDIVGASVPDYRRYIAANAGITGTYETEYQATIDGISGAVSHWPFSGEANWSSVVLGLHCDGTDGSTTVTDETGKTMTAAGNAHIETDNKKFGTASLHFDGSGDYVHTATSTDWDWASNPYTAECWVRPTAYPGAGQWSTIMSWHIGSTGWRLLMGPAGEFHLATDVGGLGGFYVGGGTIALNQWQHIAMVIDGSTLSHGYVDGIAVVGTPVATSFTAPTATTFKIGSTDGSNYMFTGYIDDVRITKGVARYSTNFTPPTKAFPVGDPTADSVGSNDGTALNTPTFEEPSLVYGDDTSVTFTKASSQWISIPAAASINNFFAGGARTVEAWVTPTSVLAGGTDFGIIIGKDDHTNTYGSGLSGWGIGYWGDNDYIAFWQRFDDGVSAVSSLVIRTPNGSVLPGSTNHVVVTYDGSSETNLPDIWINGIKQSLTTLGTPTASTTATDDSSAVLAISNADPTSAQTRYWDGTIDEVAMYNVKLSDAQILYNYNLGNSGAYGPIWNQTIGGSTVDNTVTWTTAEGYEQPGEVHGPNTLRFWFDHAYNAGNTGIAEIYVYDADGLRHLPASCVSSSGTCANVSDDSTVTYNYFTGTGNIYDAYIDLNFTNRFVLGDITVVLSAGTVVYDWSILGTYDGINWITMRNLSNQTATNWPAQTQTVSASDLYFPHTSIFRPNADLFADMDYVQGGVITWLTGDNAGLSMEVRYYDSTNNLITLFQPMPYPIKYSDTFSITSGCNHLYLGSDGTTATGHCVGRYNNGINFRGEPYVPTEDVLIGGIGETNKLPYQS